MSDAKGKATHWLVTFTHPKYQVPITQGVVLTENYTTFNDIPKILAIPRGIDSREIEIVAIMRYEGSES